MTEGRALPGVSPAGRVMLRESSGTAGRRTALPACQGLGPGGRHTPTQLQEKLTRGKLQLARGGDGAGRDPSSAVTENTRSKFLKAHHKLSSIWEPVFLAGPT